MTHRQGCKTQVMQRLCHGSVHPMAQLCEDAVHVLKHSPKQNVLPPPVQQRQLQAQEEQSQVYERSRQCQPPPEKPGDRGASWCTKGGNQTPFSICPREDSKPVFCSITTAFEEKYRS
jgi:hypothetical protein